MNVSPSTLPWPQWFFYVTCRWGFRGLFWTLGRLQVRGLENLPCRGPVILAPNHESLADPWIMCAASPNPLRSLAAEDLYAVRGLDAFLYAMGAHPLKRGEPDPGALQWARQVLSEGATLMIFPEGRCSPDGHPLPWLPGVALLALRNQVPVVPVVIRGSRQVLPLGTFRPRRGLLQVEFLAPVYPPGEGEGSVKIRVRSFLEQLQRRWGQGAESGQLAFQEACRKLQ